MNEKIIDANILQQTTEDLTSYSIYVARKRSLPDPRDGLKPVHRKIIYSLYNDFNNKAVSKVKSAAVVGRVIEKYHPHGDTSVYDAMKPMINWFQIYEPLLSPQGSFGNIWGQGAAAQRYTEVGLSKYCLDCIIADLQQAKGSTDWEDTYDGKYKEPIYFPSAVPNLLINGSFGIAVGLRTQVPSHNINEVIDATIRLIDDPNADIVLVPDDCQGSDIIATDFAKISHTGKGRFKVRAKVEVCEIDKHPALKVTSLPSLTFFESIKNKIESMVEKNLLPQVVDVINASYIDKSRKSDNKEHFEVHIILKKGADPNYVREILYNSTDLQKTISVNFEVVYDNTPVNLNYKEYLKIFLEFRKERKLRMFAGKHKACRTKAHTMELYIRVLESGEIDNIIKMIRKQKGTDDTEYIDYMIKKIPGITPLQAKFILNTDIRKLSMGYYQKYKQELEQARKEADQYYQIITHPENIYQYIKQELLEIKAKYGEPRRSRVISMDDINAIPAGTFKIIITEKGFIKKTGENESNGSFKDDKPKFVMTVDNRDSLLLFSRLGKVYKLPVHKIPFSSKGSNGIDLRTMMKGYTGDGICIMGTESNFKGFEQFMKSHRQQCNIFVLTAMGLFKRMEFDSISDIPQSGLIYTRLNDGDAVVDIILANPANQLLIYSKNKILRIKGFDAPLLNRATKGNIAMGSKYPIDGFTCITNPKGYVLAITESGYVNKVPLSVIPVSVRSRSGNNIIRLKKNDSIRKILICDKKSILSVHTMKKEYQIPVSEIQDGSSISGGIKLIDSSGIVNLGLIQQ